MSDRVLGNVIEQLRGMVGADSPDSLTDAEFLGSFLSRRSEAAFAALMRRHGPMVFNVCLRILRDRHRAEDAFQATFLVLAKKAASVRKQQSLGSWLYGVAYRVAAKMRPRRPLPITADRAECEAPDMRNTERDEQLWDELVPVIDEEVQRLPDKLRAAIVLCYLEGKTYEEAARQLKLSADCVRGRLARGRDLLRQRLARRGLAVPAAALATLLPVRAQAASVSASVIQQTLQAACQIAAGHAAVGVSAPVAAAFQGVVQEMFLRKLKIVASLVCLLAVVGLTAAGYWSAAQEVNGGEPPMVRDTPAPEGAVGQPPAPNKASLRHKLAERVTLEKGIEPNTPLSDALDFLADRYELDIIVDPKTFQEKQAVQRFDGQTIELPRIANVPVHTVLQMLLDQVDATFLVQDDHVLVTSRARARPQDWTRLERQLVPTVTVEFDKRPLDQAARELTDKSGIKIVIDSRVGDKLMTPITARLNQVAVDTAVTLLADMAGLQPVAVDTVLYITTKDNAKILQERIDQEEQRRLAALEAARKARQDQEQKEKKKAGVKE